jgi:hypothetical protein
VIGLERIALVAEDELSMSVLERLVDDSGRFVVARRLVERGFGNIKRSVTKYKQASHVLPHVVLTDLDAAECAATLRSAWGALELPTCMLFRVAVRETESWLLADSEGFASFASVARVKVPPAPEELADPKQTLVGLVRRCRNRRLASELVPPQGSAVPIGPLYNERLIGFVRNQWNVDAAAASSPSLNRTRSRLSEFMVSAS